MRKPYGRKFPLRKKPCRLRRNRICPSENLFRIISGTICATGRESAALPWTWKAPERSCGNWGLTAVNCARPGKENFDPIISKTAIKTTECTALTVALKSPAWNFTVGPGTKEEIEAICRRVLENMDHFFGATIDVAVSIEVLEGRKLKKKLGIPLGTKDSQSMLILGVAVNKKNSYTILLENGAPRISLIATFAHELTHIWQYTHGDNRKNFKQCPKSKRLLVYEGMAKWAEIQYLYLCGEINAAKREEYITRNRKDEYGIGFCLYEDRFPLSREAMACEDTPFTPDRYPFDE